MSNPTRTLFDFSDPSAADGWTSVDDVVMGGVSSSQLEAHPEDGLAAFTGHVSLDQGGGFASVRAPEALYDVSAADAFQLRVRGDGKRYKLTVYTHAASRISYRASFRPPSSWSVCTIPFDELAPFRRGRRLPDAPPFDPSDIRTIGFLISDKQAGPFELQIAWIMAVTDA